MLEFEQILFLLLGVRSGDDDVHGGGVTLLARGVDSRPKNMVGRPEESNKRLYRYRNVWEGVIIIHRRDPNRSWSRGHPKYGQDGE